MRLPYIAVPFFALLLDPVWPPTAAAQVPATPDFAACNADAAEAVKAGTASPTKGDHARADRARAIAKTTTSKEAGDAVESSNPQIHGMEAKGAKNPTFQAAYRSCMRRKGF